MRKNLKEARQKAGMIQQEVIKQETEFVVVVENNVVVEIGRTFLYHPEIQFAGQGICWLEEKIMEDERKETFPKMRERRL